jgi:hypothetical protein
MCVCTNNHPPPLSLFAAIRRRGRRRQASRAAREVDVGARQVAGRRVAGEAGRWTAIATICSRSCVVCAQLGAFLITLEYNHARTEVAPAINLVRVCCVRVCELHVLCVCSCVNTRLRVTDLACVARGVCEQEILATAAGVVLSVCARCVHSVV